MPEINITQEERVNPVNLGDAIVIAAAALAVEPETLAPAIKVGAAESALQAPFAGWGDFERYPSIPEKAAVLCSRIVRNHPFPDGNKRTAYLAMIELLERNDHQFDDSDQEQIADTIERLAAREIAEEEFIEWVRERCSESDASAPAAAPENR